MKKGLLLLAALLLIAAPSATFAQKGKKAAAKPAPNFVMDGLSQVLVPAESITKTAAPAAPAKKAKKAKKSKKSKAKAKKPSKAKKKS